MANLATLFNLALRGAIGATSLNKNNKLVTPFKAPVTTAPDITLKPSSKDYVQYLIKSPYGMLAYQKLCPSVSEPSSVKGSDYVTGPNFDNDLFAMANMSGCLDISTSSIPTKLPAIIIKSQTNSTPLYLLADSSHLSSNNPKCTVLTQPHFFAQYYPVTANPVARGVYMLMHRLFSKELFPDFSPPAAAQATVAAPKVDVAFKLLAAPQALMAPTATPAERTATLAPQALVAVTATPAESTTVKGPALNQKPVVVPPVVQPEDGFWAELTAPWVEAKATFYAVWGDLKMALGW